MMLVIHLYKIVSHYFEEECLSSLPVWNSSPSWLMAQLSEVGHWLMETVTRAGISILFNCMFSSTSCLVLNWFFHTAWKTPGHICLDVVAEKVIGYMTTHRVKKSNRTSHLFSASHSSNSSTHNHKPHTFFRACTTCHAFVFTNFGYSKLGYF